MSNTSFGEGSKSETELHNDNDSYYELVESKNWYFTFTTFLIIKTKVIFKNLLNSSLKIFEIKV